VAVCVRGKALNTMLVDDARRIRLLQAHPRLVARMSRGPIRWRPFAHAQLTAQSQKDSVRVLRATFSRLVDVRLLAGNPWNAIKDPATMSREAEMQVQKASALGLWDRVQGFLAEQSEGPWRKPMPYCPSSTFADGRLGAALRRGCSYASASLEGFLP
jgi:integrase/recombinase XerD